MNNKFLMSLFVFICAISSNAFATYPSSGNCQSKINQYCIPGVSSYKDCKKRIEDYCPKDTVKCEEKKVKYCGPGSKHSECSEKIKKYCPSGTPTPGGNTPSSSGNCQSKINQYCIPGVSHYKDCEKRIEDYCPKDTVKCQEKRVKYCGKGKSSKDCKKKTEKYCKDQPVDIPDDTSKCIEKVQKYCYPGCHRRTCVEKVEKYCPGLTSDTPRVRAERFQMSFGTIASPVSGDAFVALDAAGNINQGKTTAIVIENNTSKAKTEIDASVDDQLAISFVSQPGALTLKDFVARYGNESFTDDGSPSSEFEPSSSGRKTLEYGATLVVGPSIRPGTYFVPYDITVRYTNCAQGITNNCSSTVTRRAKVIIEQPLQVTNCGDDMDFLKVLQRSNKVSKIRMAPNGQMSIIAGDVLLLNGNQGVQGKLCLEGQPRARISVDANFVSAPDGLALENFTGSYNNLAKSINDTGYFNLLQGSQELSIGADLVIDGSSSLIGKQTLVYEVHVSYD